MDFPKETWDWAEKKAKELKTSYGRRKMNLAKGLHDVYDAMPYGFDESIKTGNWAPWPHEIKKVNCQTLASMVYVVAKKLNLNPVLRSVVGLREPGGPHGAQHFYVEVDVGAKHPVIVDPLQNMFGFFKYENNTIRILRDNDRAGRKVKEFSASIPVSESDYAQKLEYQRTAQGKFSMLVEGQKIKLVYADKYKSNRHWRGAWYVQYVPKERQLVSKVHFGRTPLQYRILGTTAKLGDEGNVESRMVTFMYAKDYHWLQLQDPKLLAALDYSHVQALCPRVRKLKRVDHGLLEDAVSSESSDELARDVRIIAMSAYDLFRSVASEQDLGMVVSEAAYQRARDDKPAVYSLDDMRGHCLESFRKNNDLLGRLNKAGTEWTLNAARMESHSRAQSKYRALSRKFSKDKSELNALFEMHKLDSEYRFSAVMDRFLFGERVLKQGLPTDVSDIELRSAYARLFTEFLITASHSRRQLEMTGIQPKIVDAIRGVEKPAVKQEVLFETAKV